nr:MAG TPA: hypothetical protein [Caudoviricetes sp.]
MVFTTIAIINVLLTHSQQTVAQKGIYIVYQSSKAWNWFWKCGI